MTTNPPKLIGEAGRLADLYARTLEETSSLKLLLTGTPGVGKTALADLLAVNLCGGRFAVESVNGRKCTIHVVAEWQRMCSTSCMFGTGWRAFIVNEIDTAPKDAQDFLLTFLDEMPANCAFICTSNLDVDQLTPRFISRLERREVAAPEPEEITRFMVEVYQIPAIVAQNIGFLCGGNVRAAEIDAKAYLNEKRATSKPARTLQPSFNLSDGVTA